MGDAAENTAFTELRGEWDEFRGQVTAKVSELQRRDDGLARLIRGTRDELIRAIADVKASVDELDDWRETTDVRNMRRTEVERAHARAAQAESEAESLATLATQTRRRTRQIIAVVAVVLPAVTEIVHAIVSRLH